MRFFGFRILKIVTSSGKLAKHVRSKKMTCYRCQSVSKVSEEDLNKVLIVEPSITFAQFAKYALTRLGYDVFHVRTATEALDKIEEVMPNLILSETSIKDMGGLELCERIKHDPISGSIPFVFVSTDGLEKTRQKAQEAGCDGYLMKPVTAGDFHKFMQNHLPFDKKRHHIRVKMHLAATIDDGEKVQEMEVLTLGEGGLYLRSQNPYMLGTKLAITLSLPSLNSPLILKGDVIYIHENSGTGLKKGMGVKFTGLNQNTAEALSHYIKSYLSDILPESPSIDSL